MSKDLVLYDLENRTQPPQCWSFNVWKTRLVLNYKKIPYSTEWVNHDTLAPALKSLGVPANNSGRGSGYTVPTIKLSDGSYVTDSAVIAKRLEAMYPSPSVHLDAELEAEVERVGNIAIGPLLANYFPAIARHVLPESTLPTFYGAREKMLGMPLAELEEKKGGEQAWEAAKPGFAGLKDLLTDRKKSEGPFIHGAEVCYADFLILALFEALKQAGEGMLDKAISMEPVFGPFYKAGQEWVSRNS